MARHFFDFAAKDRYRCLRQCECGLWATGCDAGDRRSVGILRGEQFRSAATPVRREGRPLCIERHQIREYLSVVLMPPRKAEGDWASG